MKIFEENGFTAKVDADKVSWEIPIENLVNAFNHSPDNYSEDGENFIEVKADKVYQFAEYVANALIQSCDSETGLSFIETALDRVFSDVFEDDKDFAHYP